MKTCLKHLYDLDAINIEKSGVGAGSDTFFVACTDGKYVVKYPASSEINHPEAEPELCEYLLAHGIPVCQFLRNKEGHFLTTDGSGRLFHVQRFIEGKMYDLNTAPDWLLTESAQMLGKIHTVLRDYQAVTSGNCCADRVCNHRDHSWYRDLEISAAGIYKSLSGGIAYENGKMYQRILFRDR